MTELNMKKYKSANDNVVDAGLDSELGKLDKIRDMLFGEQVDVLQRQCSKLDSSLEKNISSLRKEMQSSIDELKSKIDDNFKQLQNNISAEQADRVAENKQISLALETSNADMITKVDFEAKRLNDLVNSQYESSMQQLNDFADSLQTNKVDKTMLANLFNDFASELKNTKEK